jgi:hypothetical protein
MNQIKAFHLVLFIFWALFRLLFCVATLFIWSTYKNKAGLSLFNISMLADSIAGIFTVFSLSIYLFLRIRIFEITAIIFVFLSALTLGYIVYFNLYNYFINEKQGLTQGIFSCLIIGMQFSLIVLLRKDQNIKIQSKKRY